MTATESNKTLKRVVLHLTEQDFVRLSVLRVRRQVTWQKILTEAVNAWLAKEGEHELKDLP